MLPLPLPTHISHQRPRAGTKLHPPLLLHGETCASARRGAQLPTSAARAGQGRAAARGKFLIITEVELVRNSHNFTLKCEQRCSWASAEPPCNAAAMSRGKPRTLAPAPPGWARTSVPHQGPGPPFIFSQKDLLGTSGPRAGRSWRPCWQQTLLLSGGNKAC